jgi:hypothetical protein
VSDTEVDHVLALSFWNTKEDAERYHGDEYPTLYEPTCDGLGAELFKFRPLDKDDALPMVRKACAEGNAMAARRAAGVGIGTTYNARYAGGAEPLSGGAHDSVRPPPAGSPAPRLIGFPVGPAVLWVPSAEHAPWVRGEAFQISAPR